MCIRTVILAILVALPGTSLWVGQARAQDPYAEYNRQRAYRHFLNSPSPYRTYSSFQSGRAWGYDTPLESARFWQTPGYYHERITPYGRGSYAVPPRVGGQIIRRPIIYPFPLPPGALYPLP